ncbi:MAG TPA: substrate-binding domain-containing protein [Rhodoglobus sp.]|nr:substrate-binding domain-containing protein [Rhodoglobus sp.]
MTDDASARAVRPTLAAVAARAGVSASTASLAFSGAGPVSVETREKVLAAAEALGYAGPDPRAASLRRGRSGVLGVVIEDRLREAFRDPMNIAMLDGIADEAGAAGAALLLLTDAAGGRTDIASASMDAVILVGCSTRLDDSVAILRQRGMPMVAVEADAMDGVLGIDLDNRAASATLARHLRELGHDRVAVVSLPLDDSGEPGRLPGDWRLRARSHTARERLEGVADVYPAFGGRVAEGSTIEAGREAGMAILGEADAPTAVIAQSDLLAVGVIRAAEELGLRVPEDVAVVGFDGIRRDDANGIDLTTMVQPAVAKGRAAGRAAFSLLDGDEPARQLFTSEFRRGATT